MATLDVSKLFDQEAFSDITIKFSGREVRAHKLILCSSSEYFKAACGPDSKFKEANLSTIELFDDDVNALQTVLQYIYSSSYKSHRTDDWHSHLHVYKAATKYLVPGLAQQAVHEAKRIIKQDQDPDAILELVKIAPSHAFEQDRSQFVLGLLDHHLGQHFRKAEFRAMMEEDEKLMEVVLEILDAAPQRYHASKCSKPNCSGTPDYVGTGLSWCNQCWSLVEVTEVKRAIRWVKKD